MIPTIQRTIENKESSHVKQERGDSRRHSWWIRAEGKASLLPSIRKIKLRPFIFELDWCSSAEHDETEFRHENHYDEVNEKEQQPQSIPSFFTPQWGAHGISPGVSDSLLDEPLISILKGSSIHPSSRDRFGAVCIVPCIRSPAHPSRKFIILCFVL